MSEERLGPGHCPASGAPRDTSTAVGGGGTCCGEPGGNSAGSPVGRPLPRRLRNKSIAPTASPPAGCLLTSSWREALFTHDVKYRTTAGAAVSVHRHSREPGLPGRASRRSPQRPAGHPTAPNTLSSRTPPARFCRSPEGRPECGPGRVRGRRAAGSLGNNHRLPQRERTRPHRAPLPYALKTKRDRTELSCRDPRPAGRPCSRTPRTERRGSRVRPSAR